MVQVVGKKGALGAGVGGNCISGMDGSITITRRYPVRRFLVRLLFFHCMPAGRHSNSTRDSRRVRLCSRLLCGSYGAGSPTAVVRSHELVSCGNGGTLCRS